MDVWFWLFAGVPPFLVALGSAVLLRRWGGRKVGPPLAEIAPVLGFLAGFTGVVRGLPFSTGVAHHRIGEIAVLALVAATVLALATPGPRLGRYLALGMAVLAVFWQVPAGQVPAGDWLIALAASFVGVLILDRVYFLARIGAAALLVLAIAALGLGAVAVSARAGLLAGLALALAAAGTGWLVQARPWDKIKLGLATVGGGGVFVALGFAVLQNAARTPWALAPLILCFWAETILLYLPPLARRAKKKTQRPLAVAVASALPAIMAAVLGALLP